MEKLSKNFQRILEHFGFTYLCTSSDGETYVKDNTPEVVSIKHLQDWKLFSNGKEIAKGTSSPDLETILNLYFKEKIKIS